MNTRKRHGALPVLIMAGVGWSALVGCSETAIQGSTLDAFVKRDSTVQAAFVRGGNSELTDVIVVPRGRFGGYPFVIDGGTDDMLNAGTRGDEERHATAQWDNGDIETIWEQGMEGSWSGLKVVNNLITAFSPESFQTHPFVARGYLNSAHAERLLGDAHCKTAYKFDHTGGLELEQLGSTDLSRFDGQLVGPDSIYKRMATFAELAVAAAERAVAAGRGQLNNTDPETDALFEPENLLMAAHGAAAQAYHALATLGALEGDADPGTNWNLAVQHAAEVPTDFVEFSVLDEQTEPNPIWVASWDNDDLTLYGVSDEEGNYEIGVPATALWLDDPRVEIHDCQENLDPCAGFSQGLTEGTSEFDDEFPMWVPVTRHNDEGANFALVQGTEMRLIEAEEALMNGAPDFDTFYDKVDEVRDFWGADPTERPMVLGDFEWPNEEDDALSILDRERYLTMWMLGRRLFDMRRWEHPFLTESMAMIPRHAAILAGSARSMCAPVAESECAINADIVGDPLCQVG